MDSSFAEIGFTETMLIDMNISRTNTPVSAEMYRANVLFWQMGELPQRSSHIKPFQ